VKLAAALAVLTVLAPAAYAEVYIPDHEFTGFFDSQGVYSVVGAVKNTGDAWIVPTVTVTIQDAQVYGGEFSFAPIPPGSEQPFKVKFPELDLQSPVLLEPELDYGTVPAGIPLAVDVIYDDTLILHPDGHKTGRIVNNGDGHANYVKVYALIYSEDGRLLDMAQSLEIFESVGPGEIREFTMYPDPSVADQARYYSCFAVGDISVIQVNAERKGAPYTFRYDSGAWFAYPAFSEDGRTLVMKTQNSFPLAMMTNFEFPRYSDSEQFSILLNDEPVEYKQSLDETGNWHVIFEMPAYTSGLVSVSGFEDPGKAVPPENVLRQNPDYEAQDIPRWIAFSGAAENMLGQNQDEAEPGSADSGLYYLVMIPIAGAVAGIIVYKKRLS